MKKTLTGYLNSQYSDNEDIQTHLWDMTFSNIRSLTNHTKTPSNVLTSTHVATLNFMQLVVADVVIRNQIDGDIIEAGVFRGGMSMFLVSCLNIFEGVLERMNFMKKNNNNYMEGDKLDIIKKKKVFLADTFQGIPDRVNVLSLSINIVFSQLTSPEKKFQPFFSRFNCQSKYFSMIFSKSEVQDPGRSVSKRSPAGISFLFEPLFSCCLVLV